MPGAFGGEGTISMPVVLLIGNQGKILFRRGRLFLFDTDIVRFCGFIQGGF
jgi:hypothetical protein